MSVSIDLYGLFKFLRPHHLRFLVRQMIGCIPNNHSYRIHTRAVVGNRSLCRQVFIPQCLQLLGFPYQTRT